MLFSHSPQLLDQFPQLAVTALSVTGITAAPDVTDTTRPFLERATARLAHGRRASSPRSPVATRIQPVGLKPTQYRWRWRRCCAGFGRTACCRPSIRCRRVQRAIKCSLAQPVYERPSARRAATRVSISAPKLSTATRTRMIRLLLPSHTACKITTATETPIATKTARARCDVPRIRPIAAIDSPVQATCLAGTRRARRSRVPSRAPRPPLRRALKP
jgi:hypothetical protein